ncbi:MAG: hypothetical protein WC501_04220 [Candidatus Micrarchaeia archaeon]
MAKLQKRIPITIPLLSEVMPFKVPGITVLKEEISGKYIWEELIQQTRTNIYGSKKAKDGIQGNKLINLQIVKKIFEETGHELSPDLKGKIAIPRFFKLEENIDFDNNQEEIGIKDNYDWIKQRRDRFFKFLNDARAAGLKKIILRSNGVFEDWAEFFAPGAYKSPILDLSMTNEELCDIFMANDAINCQTPSIPALASRSEANKELSKKMWRKKYDYIVMEYVEGEKKFVNVGTSPHSPGMIEIMVSKQPFDYDAPTVLNAIAQDNFNVRHTINCFSKLWNNQNPIDYIQEVLDGLPESQFQYARVRKIPLDQIYVRVLYNKNTKTYLLEGSSLFETTYYSLNNLLAEFSRKYNEYIEPIGRNTEFRKRMQSELYAKFSGYHKNIMKSCSNLEEALRVLENCYLDVIKFMEKAIQEKAPAFFDYAKRNDAGEYFELELKRYSHLTAHVFGGDIRPDIYAKFCYLSLVESLKHIRSLKENTLITDSSCIGTHFEKKLSTQVELELIGSQDKLNIVQLKPAAMAGDYLSSLDYETDSRRTSHYAPRKSYAFDPELNTEAPKKDLSRLKQPILAIAGSYDVFEGDIKSIDLIDAKNGVYSVKLDSETIRICSYLQNESDVSNHGYVSVRARPKAGESKFIVSPFLGETLNELLSSDEYGTLRVRSDGKRVFIYSSC